MLLANCIDFMIGSSSLPIADDRATGKQLPVNFIFPKLEEAITSEEARMRRPVGKIPTVIITVISRAPPNPCSGKLFNTVIRRFHLCTDRVEVEPLLGPKNAFRKRNRFLFGDSGLCFSQTWLRGVIVGTRHSSSPRSL